MLAFENKIYLLASIVCLFVILALGHGDAGSLQVVENSAEKSLVSPASLTRTQELKLVSFLTLTVKGVIMAVYDDASTKRAVDYAEVHNPAGDLLAILWFDRFGILRTLVDQSLILNKDNVEGVMVLVLDGDLV